VGWSCTDKEMDAIERLPRGAWTAHLPARLTRGQRKRWLHLRADWPWTQDLITAWQAVKALPAPA
jgi:hypothetical protein